VPLVPIERSRAPCGSDALAVPGRQTAPHRSHHPFRTEPLVSRSSMQPLFANVVLDVFFKGGPIMWPILFCLVAAAVVVLERAIWWTSLGRRSNGEKLKGAFEAIAQGRFQDAVHLARQGRDPFLATVHEGLMHAHASLLGAMQLRATDEIDEAEKRLWILGTLITLAPLLGLLGRSRASCTRSALWVPRSCPR
jgi:hypothetical protein